MGSYYFNDNTDEHGYHEVHTSTCSFLPAPMNRTYLGIYNNCSEAIADAKRRYPGKVFDGCYYCCNSCHRG